MKITIDRAGRVVLPKSVRDRLHLVAGTELEVHPESEGVSLRVATRELALVDKEGVLVHHGAGISNLDVADFIRRERVARAIQKGMAEESA